MSEETIPNTAASEEDVNTTPPNPAIKDGKAAWSMPEPVFRKTSGYLPQGYEKRFSQEPEPASDDSDSAEELPASDAPSLAIEPQPELPDQSEAMQPEMASQPVKKTSSGSKVVFTILGFLLAVAIIVVFIAVIYVLFLRPQGSESPF